MVTVKSLIEANLVNGTVSVSLHAEVFEQAKRFSLSTTRRICYYNLLNAGSALSEADVMRGSQVNLAVPALAFTT